MRAIVTGSCGLVGFSATSRLLCEGWEVLGIDNDQRRVFFGDDGSTSEMTTQLCRSSRYTHYPVDIRVRGQIKLVAALGFDLIIHCAAQPSHDWATTHIYDDFEINALGTLNMLDVWRNSCPTAPFIHVSTSKVYGDNPNRIPLVEMETRWDVPPDSSLWNGVPEIFSVDQCLHSFFGVSKLTGDLLAQEYGRHFRLPVGVFRPGCVTGGHHRGVELHGFLNYLMGCVTSGKEYRIYGHKGKQVRCNVHSEDLVDAFLRFASNPRPGEVYNVGGRSLACSMQEAIVECEKRCGKKANTVYMEQPRTGDHIWWISDTRKLARDTGWSPRHSLASIYDEIYDAVHQQKTPGS